MKREKKMVVKTWDVFVWNWRVQDLDSWLLLWVVCFRCSISLVELGSEFIIVMETTLRTEGESARRSIFYPM